MPSRGRRDLGRLFDEVPELYDRVRPTYPDELFADLAAITGMDEGSTVLEVGCGTGQATCSLATRGCSVIAIEPGTGMADLARQRLAGFDNVQVETSTFEEWDEQGRRFDLLLAAASWHWVDPSVGWSRAHRVLRRGGWMALIGHVVVRRPGEPEVYAETADLHQRYCPGNPGWTPLLAGLQCQWGSYTLGIRGMDIWRSALAIRFRGAGKALREVGLGGAGGLEGLTVAVAGDGPQAGLGRPCSAGRPPSRRAVRPARRRRGG